MERKTYLEIGCIPSSSEQNTKGKPNPKTRIPKNGKTDLNCLLTNCSKTRLIRPPLKYTGNKIKVTKVIVPKKTKKERIIIIKTSKIEKKIKPRKTKSIKISKKPLKGQTKSSAPDPLIRSDIVEFVNDDNDNLLEVVQSRCKLMGLGLDGNYERLLISLQSPFPNEHEFALNVCMILSAEETKNLNIFWKAPAILNMLLAHVGFYHDCGLRSIMEQTYVGNKGCFNMDFSSFWNKVIGVKGHLREILCECHEKYEGLSEMEKVLQVTGIDEGGSSGKCCEGCQMKNCVINDNWNDGAGNLEVSTLCNGVEDKLVKRVHQVGEILRNFSFETDNATVMAGNGTLMRFLLIASESDVGSLPRIASDIWSNISNVLKLSSEDSVFSQFPSRFLSYIKTCVYSNDRFKIIRSLEIIPGLAKVEENKPILKSFLDEEFLQKLFTLMTLSSDKEFVINCLECIVSSTQMGKALCDRVVGIHGAVKILVAYLTFAVHEWWSYSATEKIVYGYCDVYSNSVRLTAALCLRNLAQHSQNATRSIQHYELQLAEIAMNGCESSFIVAQVLYHLDLDSSLDNRRGESRNFIL